MSNLSAPEAECNFIGCMVSGEGAALEDFPIHEDHFLHPLAKRTYLTAHCLRRNGSPISVGSIMQAIGWDNMGEHVHQYSELCNYPIPSEAGHWFKVIDDKLTLRRANALAQWLSKETAAEASGVNVEDMTRELQRRASELESQSESENVLQASLAGFSAKLDRMERGERETGIQTGIGAWDRLFGGMLDGQLYGIAGRPGTGKTTLMEQMVAGYLAKDIPVSIFEKDMSPQKLVERMACRATNVPYWTVARGMVSNDRIPLLRGAIQLLSQSKIYLYNPSGLTAERMCSIAKRDIRQRGVKAVFLDHVQALRVGDDYRVGLTQASLAIRENVTTTGVPHVILAHINRTGAKGRPSPEDIKEFDQLYGDADGMLLLWSKKDRTELKDDELLLVEFYGAKNRDGGVKEDQMLFDGPRMKFVEQAHGQ